MINAVGFNHNGQLVVTGDVSGMIKIYEIRSLSRIMEWSASSQPILSCTFSFDETSIYSVDAQGQLSQDSVHKPDRRIDTYPLQGFKSSTLSSAMMMATSSSNSTRSAGGSSVRSKPFIRTTSSGAPVNSASVLRKHSEGSVSMLANIAIVAEAGTGQDESGSGGGTVAAGSLSTQQSTQQGAKASIGKDTSTLTAMNVGPGQLLGWSGDTDHLVMGCGNAGVIVQVRELAGLICNRVVNWSVMDMLLTRSLISSIWSCSINTRQVTDSKCNHYWAIHIHSLAWIGPQL